jgi:hypothetical protein
MLPVRHVSKELLQRRVVEGIYLLLVTPYLKSFGYVVVNVAVEDQIDLI